MAIKHTHQLILIRDPLESYKIYWCIQCGMVMELFDETYAELLPEWSKERLLKEDENKDKHMVVQREITSRYNKRLGKSLRDIKVPSLDSLAKILENNRRWR